MYKDKLELNNFKLTYLNTGDFSLIGPKKTVIIKERDLDRALFLLNVSQGVREALKVEIDELASNYWEFDKQILIYSEWSLSSVH